MTRVWLGVEQEATGTPRKVVGKERSLEEVAFKLRTDGLLKAKQESCRGQDERECEPLVEPKAVLSVCVGTHVVGDGVHNERQSLPSE